MRNILMIMKKELTRFFTDRRMLVSIFLPGILIYFLYTFMGDAMMGNFVTDDEYRHEIVVCNPSPGVSAFLDRLELNVSEIDESELEEAKGAIKADEADALLLLPDDFDNLVAAYTPADGDAPQVRIWYNSASTESAEAYQILAAALDQYETVLANKFDINGDGEIYDLASDSDMTTMIFSMMLPMLLMTFMFSSCMAVAPESIAGEKERGTIATLLVTPIKRSELAIGKIVSLSIIALCGGVVSFLGVMLSLPNLMGGMEGISSSVYTTADYVLILAVILTTILVFISAISILSAFSNSVKEASSSISVLMIAVMLCGITSMFGNGAPTELHYYLIPVYNSVQSLNGIFLKAYSIPNLLTALASNVVYAGAMIYILTKMFNSERVMFRK